jgi:DNA (cytosine-5)-methyltransferase 1
VSGLYVDMFCGAGGATLGIERAIGRPVDIAVNHDAHSIETHAANHPLTKHYREDVWKVDPIEACAGRPVELLWLSPSCTHFSRAKGGKPLDTKIRSLAWVAVRWARAVRPRIIAIENLPEWRDWSPLNADNRPCVLRKGLTFRRFVGNLRNLGYTVEWNVIDSADLGVPQHRRRLFMVARCDGLPIVWPEPTHGPLRAHAWRGAHEIIDWSIPVPSIFGRKRPLVDATMRRIAQGLRRFVFESASPFIIRTGHYSHRSGEGFQFRGQSLDKPLGVVCATNEKALIVPYLSQYFGGMVGKDLRAPLPTVTARDHNALAAAWLTKWYGTATGSSLFKPAPTVTGGGQHVGAVHAYLVKYFGACEHGQTLFDSLHTVTSKPRFGLVMVEGEPYQLVDIGLRMLSPRELARAQGFPDDYLLAGTQAQQVARIGNAVVPQVAEAIVRANVLERSLSEAAS